MNTEHRYCARHPIELEVHIQYRNRRFFSARGTDISNHGMFLQVRNLTLPTGTMVDLALHALGRDWLIPALVVHRDQSGIGVMFRDPQPDLFRSLPQHGSASAYRCAQLEVPAERLGA